ncbi:MAG: hypothetical protein IMF15_08020 [Proteobacteria bacterium]|nr:hypothetical protein [Pseudomonadota bacterium]
MKIFRWLLSHFFLILLIVVVIYGYMFWGNLAGEDTPAGKALAYLSSEFVEVEEFINAVKAKQAQLSTDKNTTEGEQLTASADPDKMIAAENSPMQQPAQQPAQQPVSISYSHNQMRVKQNSAGDIQAERLPQTNVAAVSNQPRQFAEPVPAVRRAEAAVNKAPDKFVSTQVEKQLDNVDVQGKVIDKSLQAGTVRESWVTARKSFYQRKYDLSEQSYQDVIANTEDNFDAYGELGNVYFNQGKNDKAAKAYFEAASILVRKGQIRRAKSLMGLLRHLDKSKADDLQKLIDSTVS